ncbi:hypothetical protein SK128_028159, partial [Halocaridina rubra]
KKYSRVTERLQKTRSQTCEESSPTTLQGKSSAIALEPAKEPITTNFQEKSPRSLSSLIKSLWIWMVQLAALDISPEASSEAMQSTNSPDESQQPPPSKKTGWRWRFWTNQRPWQKWILMLLTLVLEISILKYITDVICLYIQAEACAKRLISKVEAYKNYKKYHYIRSTLESLTQGSLHFGLRPFRFPRCLERYWPIAGFRYLFQDILQPYFQAEFSRQ